jgi:hypothetical protein
LHWMAFPDALQVAETSVSVPSIHDRKAMLHTKRGATWPPRILLPVCALMHLSIAYPEDEQPTAWPQEPKEEEQVDNYVKPLEMSKPPALVEASPKKRRGSPRNVKLAERN